MIQQFAQVLVGFLYNVLYRTPAQREAQGQGVDKHPQYLIRPGAALQPAEQHRAKHHILAAAGLCQHLCPGHMEQHTGADPETTRLGADRFCELRGDRELRFRDKVIANFYVNDAKRCRGFINIRQLAAEIGFMLGNGGMQGLRDKVAVR
ncbi:hypothetical protein Xkoz_03654 [Xenorhabdus kozodoii]|uniref:Uncharacterized protein n=1 Tax=Xenorhabdus kozodoii TaxID=351676 RepID=A0A2D0KZ08_9GAMM|nr:hypothetical protein Xkoz_03654 [Xenorhabdus kozodoii]